MWRTIENGATKYSTAAARNTKATSSELCRANGFATAAIPARMNSPVAASPSSPAFGAAINAGSVAAQQGV